MSRRDQIRMTDDEVREFLRERHTLNVATIGPAEKIHLVAMWYGFLPESDTIAFWTYGKSQKILNLRRDPRMSGLVETGETYDQLRGVELVGTGTVIEDRDVVQAVGESVWERHTGPVDDNARAAVVATGAKRLVVRFDVDKIVSWDHRKLGGRY
jgi:PPOX class probable F420-dependent enzyme